MSDATVTLVTGTGGGIAASIARTLAARGHRLLLLSRSGAAEATGADAVDPVLPDDRSACIRDTALHVFSRPGAIAETVAFLLSPGAGYITGQSITIDGGVNRPVSF